MPASADRLAAVLGGYGFERLLDVPAVPAGARAGYDTAVPLDPGGEVWQLRSAGLGFSLVHRSWRRVGLRRVYSVGWGLTAGAAARGSLLLAQAYVGDKAEGHSLGGALGTALADLTERLDWAVDSHGGEPCLRLSAMVPDAR